MDSRLTVTAFGPAPAGREVPAAPEKALAHFQKRIRLLMDTIANLPADLIVLPEGIDCRCDGPAAEREAHYRANAGNLLDLYADLAAKRKFLLIYAGPEPTAAGWCRTVWLCSRSGEAKPVNRRHYASYPELESGGLMAPDTGKYQKRDMFYEAIRNQLDNTSPEPSARGLVRQEECGPEEETDFGRVLFLGGLEPAHAGRLAEAGNSPPDLIVHTSTVEGARLASAWAGFCGCHFVGAYPGSSVIIAPGGDVIARSTKYFNHARAEIRTDTVLVFDHRPRLIALKKKHGPRVQIEYSALTGAVRVSAAIDGLPTRELLDGSGLVPWHDEATRLAGRSR